MQSLLPGIESVPPTIRLLPSDLDHSLVPCTPQGTE